MLDGALMGASLLVVGQGAWDAACGLLTVCGPAGVGLAMTLLKGALQQHLGHVQPIGRRSPGIIDGPTGTLECAAGCLQRQAIAASPLQGFFCLMGAHGDRRHAAQPQSSLAYDPGLVHVEPQGERYSGNVVLVALGDLFSKKSLGGRQPGDMDGLDVFGPFQGRGPVAGEKPIQCHPADAFWAAQLQRGTQCQQYGCHVAHRGGVGQVAADGAAIADLG